MRLCCGRRYEWWDTVREWSPQVLQILRFCRKECLSNRGTLPRDASGGDKEIPLALRRPRLSAVHCSLSISSGQLSQPALRVGTVDRHGSLLVQELHRVLYTDGVRYLVEQAWGYWLIDFVRTPH